MRYLLTVNKFCGIIIRNDVNDKHEFFCHLWTFLIAKFIKPHEITGHFLFIYLKTATGFSDQSEFLVRFFVDYKNN